jgi:four helix bundle protein
MATVNAFEELEVWQLSRDLCKEIGLVIDNGCLKNNFKLIGQVEAASGSIMDNIAEGFERGTKAEFIQFLGYAKGSCGELRSQLNRMWDRNYINKEKFIILNEMTISITRMLQKFIGYLQGSKIEGLRRKNIIK